MNKKKAFITAGLALGLFTAGCSAETAEETAGENQPDQENNNNQEEQMEGSEQVFNLEVQETEWSYNEDLVRNAWTYNGTLPGEEIRVSEGDTVVLNVKNSLDIPTAIHLHGFPVPNEMDGVPGVTQNAIMPGEEFTYEYEADVPGTYWYHSHQDGATQVGEGLYGVFIVEPAEEENYDTDETIVIHEISSMDMDDMDHGNMDHGNMNEEDMNGMDHGDMDHDNINEEDMNGIDHGDMDHDNMNEEDMNGMDHGDMDMDDLSHTEMMNLMYDTMIINGKTSPEIEAINVEEGNKVKLRFLNAGLFTQVVEIPGHSFKVTHYDGQPVNEPEWISEMAFRIAPAERYEVEIEMDNPGAWGIEVYAEENKEGLNTVIPVIYEGHEEEEVQLGGSFTNFFDFTVYGEKLNTDIGEPTKEFDMLLGTDDGGETFTINGKQFPDHEIYEVEEGDVVKFTITNDTDDDHPMHLHGEFFTVTAKDGNPVEGSPIVKDTLNVRPGEEYEIVFKAENSGNWLFHCHEFHHASGGMVAEIKYKDYEPFFTPDPDIPNKPE
ncbi:MULTISPECIES: multicopper oxidase family protein [Evansella]|uniref:multicopper oxidase family protein n=1 Tax=Evansella TaxID=2837485 RepID=UPI0009985BB5|nr:MULTISPECIES: multicopper oxidase family protein [Evansella]